MASFIFTAVIVLMVVIIAINIVSPRPPRRRPGHGSVDIFPDPGTGSVDPPNKHHGGHNHSGGSAGHHGGAAGHHGGSNAGFGGHHCGGFGGGHHG